MRTRIEVSELSPRQWRHLVDNVPVDGREFLAGIPRSCVMFENQTDGVQLHIEMDMVELAGLAVVLAGIQARELAEAVPVPDAEKPRLVRLPSAEQVRNLTAGQAADLAREMNQVCDHGCAVVKEEPSAFGGVVPVRTFSDGCQSYGSYQNES